MINSQFSCWAWAASEEMKQRHRNNTHFIARFLSPRLNLNSHEKNIEDNSFWKLRHSQFILVNVHRSFLCININLRDMSNEAMCKHKSALTVKVKFEMSKGENEAIKFFWTSFFVSQEMKFYDRNFEFIKDCLL